MTTHGFKQTNSGNGQYWGHRNISWPIQSGVWKSKNNQYFRWFKVTKGHPHSGPNDRVSWCVARLPNEFRWIFGAYISRLMGKRKPISICLGVSNSCFYIFPTISRMMMTPSDLFGFFFHDLTVTSPEIWLV